MTLTCVDRYWLMEEGMYGDPSAGFWDWEWRFSGPSRALNFFGSLKLERATIIIHIQHAHDQTRIFKPIQGDHVAFGMIDCDSHLSFIFLPCLLTLFIVVRYIQKWSFSFSLLDSSVRCEFEFQNWKLISNVYKVSLHCDTWLLNIYGLWPQCRAINNKNKRVENHKGVTPCVH